MSNEALKQTSRFGNLLVITAPSGAGKSTLVARLREAVEGVAFSISYTTRAPRAGEQHGREYFFIDKEEFEQRRARNEFLEWAQVYHNYYGTHRDCVNQALAAGQDIVLDIDVQGAEQVKKAMPQAVLIFIMPPSLETLSERLNNRGLDEPDVIARRIRIAAEEVARYHEFDYIIVNDDLATATAALVAITRAERQRPARLQIKIDSILASFQK